MLDAELAAEPETVAHLVERQGQGERPKARGCEDDELACFLQLEDYLSLPAPRTMQARPNSLRGAKAAQKRSQS